MAGAHVPGNFAVRQRPDKFDILKVEAREQAARLVWDRAYDPQLLVRVPQLRKSLEKVGDSFANGHRPDKQHTEAVLSWFFARLEAVKKHAQGDSRKLFLRNPHL